MDRIAAVMLFREDGAVLLQHRDGKPGLRCAGQWGPPGGHCEADEEIEDCARRGFQEETRYICDTLELVTQFINASEAGWPPQEL